MCVIGHGHFGCVIELQDSSWIGTIAIKQYYNDMMKNRIHIALDILDNQHDYDTRWIRAMGCHPCIRCEYGYIMQYQGSLDPFRWFYEWCGALVELGVIHGDLKNDNIFDNSLIDYDNYLFQLSGHSEWVASDIRHYPILNGDESHGTTLLHNEIWTATHLVYQHATKQQPQTHASMNYPLHINNSQLSSNVPLPSTNNHCSACPSPSMCIYGSSQVLYIVCMLPLDVHVFLASILHVNMSCIEWIHTYDNNNNNNSPCIAMIRFYDYISAYQALNLSNASKQFLMDEMTCQTYWNMYYTLTTTTDTISHTYTDTSTVISTSTATAASIPTSNSNLFTPQLLWTGHGL